MKIESTAIRDVLVIRPRVFKDSRGYFFESYNQSAFTEATKLDVNFVQDNQSHSGHGVLRGLHYQVEQQQGKLVRVAAGTIFDVAVDIRKTSPTFGRWVGVELSSANFLQLWVPAGFAHGFLVTSDSAEVIYKTTDYYAPAHERCLRWDDSTLSIEWPRLDIAPIVSNKDAAGSTLDQAELM